MISASAVARAWSSNIYALIGCLDRNLIFPEWAGNGYALGVHFSLSPLAVFIVFASTILLLFGIRVCIFQFNSQ